MDSLNHMLPYFQIKKDYSKFLVNIKDWVMEVVELPYDISDSKFEYNDNIFRVCNKVHY